MPKASASRGTSPPVRARPPIPGRGPAGARAGEEAAALGDAAREVEDERDRQLGGGGGEDAGRVRDEDPATGGCGEVDVVVADGVVRDDAKLRARRIEEL